MYCRILIMYRVLFMYCRILFNVYVRQSNVYVLQGIVYVLQSIVYLYCSIVWRSTPRQEAKSGVKTHHVVSLEPMSDGSDEQTLIRVSIPPPGYKTFRPRDIDGNLDKRILFLDEPKVSVTKSLFFSTLVKGNRSKNKKVKQFFYGQELEKGIKKVC